MGAGHRRPVAIPDGGFEVVCCQLGLQFFPDRAAALAEMARVLAPGGRLAVMVWQSIDHSPGFAVLAAAMDRHIGSAAGAIMRAPFGLADERALRDLVAGAGFQDVRVDRQAGVVRFGSARSPTGLVRRWPGRSRPLVRRPRRDCWPRSRLCWTHGRGLLGLPSRSRRCWSAAAAEGR
jgi:SAM-dependent methyltransferase